MEDSSRSVNMDSGLARSAIEHESFRPWFQFGPILILLLYWLGSASAYLFSYLGEFVPLCIPHIEGCTSISRTGRFGTSFYIFKIAVIPVAFLAFVYWLDMTRWNKVSAPNGHFLNIAPTILGCLGATALLVQTTVLGIECGVCRSIRSYSTTMFFLLTFIAQWLAWIRIRKQSERNWVSVLYLILCTLLSIDVALFVIVPNLFENTSALENSIAWRSSYLIALAPAISAAGWRGLSGNQDRPASLNSD